MFEDPCSKLQEVFDRKEVCHFQIRSLTPQPAKHCRQAEPAGNALACPVQENAFGMTHIRSLF
jgi:hypothetical protein